MMQVIDTSLRGEAPRSKRKIEARMDQRIRFGSEARPPFLQITIEEVAEALPYSTLMWDKTEGWCHQGAYRTEEEARQSARHLADLHRGMILTCYTVSLLRWHTQHSGPLLDPREMEQP